MKKIVLLTLMTGSFALATPALAGGWGWGGSKPHHPRPPSGGSTSGGSHAVPEPGMMGLMGAGVVGLVIARRRKRQG